MSVSYQIFVTAPLADVKNIAIDILLGYPNGADRYRLNYPHPSVQDVRVVCEIGPELVEACAGMSATERLNYYDVNALVDLDYVVAQGWFPDPY